MWIRVVSNSKHWFTTSGFPQGGRCRKAMIGVWVSVDRGSVKPRASTGLRHPASPQGENCRKAMLGVWVSVDKGNVKLQALVYDIRLSPRRKVPESDDRSVGQCIYDIRLPPRRKVPESDARSMGFSSDKLPLTLAKDRVFLLASARCSLMSISFLCPALFRH